MGLRETVSILEGTLPMRSTPWLLLVVAWWLLPLDATPVFAAAAVRPACCVSDHGQDEVGQSDAAGNAVLSAPPTGLPRSSTPVVRAVREKSARSPSGRCWLLAVPGVQDDRVPAGGHPGLRTSYSAPSPAVACCVLFCRFLC